ncbi:MAG: putative addiction module antidote protein [Elusimicrobia bacterium GWA2_56_46]|jgi:probable addiction module antidote protein|nr:MAG: putative addiction module antidote protein [Elusimicrobia bacterium GWA2_56_46]OGR43388.1 MAG: putative addiction module antidote protein [Elusimicrobia bacterium GWA2_56_46]OGR55874.1 MAG: putative addiction module antidote protein [Elusimicrobia bacterium GWC2_56_31]HBB67381.1 putative addiction module antidote protein [Elusimicrobiota bacterium]HBW22193.1 putative addiction module antidote protein [Elusimicrobiota bacterium]
MKNYRTHDDYLNKALKDPKEAALYMNAAVEENDPALMLAVLAQVVRAHGISKMAKKISLSRAGVYKTLSKKGNPELKTFMGILSASGLEMSFKPSHTQHHVH